MNLFTKMCNYVQKSATIYNYNVQKINFWFHKIIDIRLIYNIETLFKNFNAYDETSIITVLDEICNKCGSYKNVDTLRSIVTRKTFMVEPKGIDKYCAHDYNDYVFITNNDWIVKVTMSDRMYCCFEVSQKYIGNISYFDDIVKSCFNDEVGI